MYELTCPACRKVMETPFVRLGAVAVCRLCGQPFPVKSDSFRRAGANGAPAGAAAAGAPAGDASDSIAGDEVAELDREHDTDDATGDFTDEELTLPADALAGDGTDAAASATDRLEALARHRRLIAWSMLGLAALMVVVGAMAMAISSGTAPEITTLDPELPIVTPVRLEEGEWETVDPSVPFAGRTPGLPIDVPSLRPVGEGMDTAIEAEVVARGAGAVETATITLVLLGEDQRVIAESKSELALLMPQRPQTLRVPVPRQLFGRAGDVEWDAEVGEVLTAAEPFRDQWVEPQHGRGGPTVKVTAYNPLERPIRRAIFVLRAYEHDADDRLVGSWAMQWTRTVQARQRIEFAAILPGIANPASLRWEVRGACEP